MIVYLKEYGGSLISEEDILRKYGKRGLQKFNKWMSGQTRPYVHKQHVIASIPEEYKWYFWSDYARYAKGLPVVD